MSGVYIKGMEMPIDCYDCLLSSDFNLYGEDGYCVSGMECPLLNQVIDDDSKRLPDCPLIPVPDHGRLIDADAFERLECNGCDGACECVECDCVNCDAECRCDFMLDIRAAQTIIPADKEAGE